jgi:hypothetical protein
VRIAVAVLNLVAFLFISFVLVTDGPPDPGADTLFALWSLLTKLFSAWMILCTAERNGWLGPVARVSDLAKAEKTKASASVISGLIFSAIVCNIVLVGFVCWHLAGQYNHPSETGAIPLAVLMVLTPALSLAVLLRSSPRQTRPGPRPDSAPQ